MIFAIAVALACPGRLSQGRDHKGRCAQWQADRASRRGHFPDRGDLVGGRETPGVINSSIAASRYRPLAWKMTDL
jgi:hypothetical protein